MSPEGSGASPHGESSPTGGLACRRIDACERVVTGVSDAARARVAEDVVGDPEIAARLDDDVGRVADLGDLGRLQRLRIDPDEAVRQQPMVGPRPMPTASATAATPARATATTAASRRGAARSAGPARARQRRPARRRSDSAPPVPSPTPARSPGRPAPVGRAVFCSPGAAPPRGAPRLPRGASHGGRRVRR